VKGRGRLEKKGGKRGERKRREERRRLDTINQKPVVPSTTDFVVLSLNSF
jgi:hypothetical protein